MISNTLKQEFETVIGLEVHLQFNTQTKIFCGCANTFGNQPNTNTCPVCLGLPGTLPVFNKTVLTYAIKTALALNAHVNTHMKFDRKNYYYPDLPKGYQISQYDLPIASDGFIMIPAPKGKRKIKIHRAHLEEDAGKLIHDPDNKCSLVDYNRTGTPLMEIVTEPDIQNPQEAYDYLTILKLLLQYLNVSDCDMEKGSLRCDANISIRPKGERQLGTKTELKNMNSFKAVKTALEFEDQRQRQTVLAGKRIVQETRLWNEETATTTPMRSKEKAHDYRYFPEPDLVGFIISPEKIEDVRKSLPELPHDKLKRLLEDYPISEYDAQILIQDPYLADFFEQCSKFYSQNKKICNWIIGPLQQELNARRIESANKTLPERKARIGDIHLKPEFFTDLITKVEDGVVSNLVGKDILKILIDTGKTPDEVIQQQDLAQVSDDTALNKIIEEVLAENDAVVQQIRQGKESALGFLVGQAMRKTQGKANPKKTGEMIKRRISDG